jgi:hypothetical protein
MGKRKKRKMRDEVRVGETRPIQGGSILEQGWEQWDIWEKNNDDGPQTGTPEWHKKYKMNKDYEDDDDDPLAYPKEGGGTWSSGPRTTVVTHHRWCEHWQTPVKLLEGITVYASAWYDRPQVWTPKNDWPDVGFYMDSLWIARRTVTIGNVQAPFVDKHQPKNRIVVYPWSDYGIPDSARQTKAALWWLLQQARKGHAVEIGCLGGHGRTGSVIAGMLVLQGMEPKKAIKKVRREYCVEAVETSLQTQFLREIAHADLAR